MFLKNNLKYIYEQLSEWLSVTYPGNEARSISKILLESLNYTEIDLITRSDHNLLSEEIEFLELAIERLQNHEPVQYILGYADFYGLKFKVNPSVLIPRQETEELVDLIIKENSHLNPGILDIGTGSGCIALSLKKNIPASKIDALDVSEAALKTAIENSRILELNVHFHHIDILHEAILPGQYDIIVSNPPYVTEAEKSEILGNVLHHEPGLALFIPDQSPLIFYECIVELATQYLNDAGKLYLEINERLGNEVRILLKEAGFKNIRILKDLNGKDRMATSVFFSKT